MSHKDPWPQSKEFDLSWQECHLMDLISQMSGEDPQRIGIMVASHNEDTVKDSSNSILKATWLFSSGSLWSRSNGRAGSGPPGKIIYIHAQNYYIYMHVVILCPNSSNVFLTFANMVRQGIAWCTWIEIQHQVNLDPNTSVWDMN